MTIRSSVYAFVDDFVDAGPANVANALVSQGFSGVALGAVYHAARDLLPHNPKRMVAHRVEGVHYFTPDDSLYAGPLRPLAADRPQLFGEVTSQLQTHGLSWQAWAVYLHNERLAGARPEYAVTNAFGDRYTTDLCPSADDVAQYAADLTADLARLGPSLILAESLHHTGFEHGYHHERAFVDVPPAASFLLSVCFCASCIDRAARHDVDAPGLAARLRDVVRALLVDETPAELERDTLAALCGEPLLAYLRLREATVTELAGRCAEVARAQGVRFGVIDQTGALKGYAHGDPQGPASADDAWRLGLAPAEVAAAVDSYVVLAYAKRPERVAADTGSYAKLVASQAELRCVLRHGGPDFRSAADLAEKVRAATACGADAVDFYHYGLMPLRGLDAAAAAIAGADGPSTGA